jgi:hypothetical protein
MIYDIVYGEHSLDRLLDLSLELRAPGLLDIVEEAMGRWATDLVRHGTRGRALYQLPNGKVIRPQEFDFHGDAAPGRRVHFRAHFYYGEDEASLRIVKLTVHPHYRL